MSLDDLHVGRARVAYRMPRRLASERGRLDRALGSDVRDGRLDLSGCGLGPEELLCIRSLRTPTTRVRAGEGGEVLAERFVRGVEQAIREALTRDNADVVRYRSHRHALVDLVVRAARGDHSRGWAFAELGFWSAANQPRGTALIERALAALASQPLAIVPVLSAAAEQGALPALVHGGTAPTWAELSRLALRAAGFRALDLSTPFALARETSTQPHDELGVLSALERNALVRALARVPASSLSEPKRRALAVLCALGIEPFRRSAEVPIRAVIELARDLVARTEGDPTSPSESSPRDLAPPGEAEGPPNTHVLDAGEAGSATQPSGVEASSQSVEASEASAQGVVTRAGGLLFLVHLLSELDLYTELENDPVLARHSLRMLLHPLARKLGALSPEDPAALAFIGLAPTAEPPDATEFTPEEGAALGRYSSRLVEALTERLAPSELEPQALLAWVIERRARIFADPGWIEVRFSLDDVATELRRARLDLHPNWLAPLGVVLRFTYE